MSEHADAVKNRLKLLSEINTCLGNLIQFNLDHPEHWTPTDMDDYNKLRIAWGQAVDTLSSFDEKPIKQH